MDGMPFVKKKSKTPGEETMLQLSLSRLRGVDELVMNGNEPMLSIRLKALVSDVEIALLNSKVQNKHGI